MTHLPDPGPQPGVHDLGYARLDTDRLERTGDAEVVYGAGKTPAQVVELLRTLHATHPAHAVLATRLTVEAQEAVAAALPAAVVDPVGRTAVLGEPPVLRGTVAVVAAGTSDAPVAAEAATTARVFGAEVDVITDVGVAGLHRVMGGAGAARRGGLPDRRRGDGGRAAERRRRARRRAAGRGTDVGRVRRLVRRGRGAAGDAELVRARV